MVDPKKSAYDKEKQAETSADDQTADLPSDVAKNNIPATGKEPAGAFDETMIVGERQILDGEQVHGASPAIGRTESGRTESGTTDHAQDSRGELSQDVLHEDYELIEEIARGGMGVVYKARQKKLNRVVAIKMILSGQLASADDIQRFYTEAESAARLQHPSIVPIFDIGEWQGRHYFSMGYIEGTSLSDSVREGPLTSSRAASMTREIAMAIGYAHDEGIIHRDLKPANVLLDAAGSPHITDFGLAKSVSGNSDLTGTGQVLGTPSYMPPEQASGGANEVDETADIYSLGAILYFLLTARPPFQASSLMETLKQVLEQEPVSPSRLNSTVPSDLETICLKCLEKDSSKRYETAAALADDLQRFLNGEPILARPVTMPTRIARWCTRNPGIAGLLLAVAISLLLGIGISAYFAIQSSIRLGESQESLRVANAATKQSAIDAADAKASAIQAQLERDTSERALAKTERLREIAKQQLDESTPLGYAHDMRLLQLDWQRMHPTQRELLLRKYHPKHQLVATGADLRGWDWYYLRGMNRHYEHSLTDHESPVELLEWSPDGQWLATASKEQLSKEDSILVWDTQSGKVYRTFTGYSEPIESIAWQPDGSAFASGHRNGQVIVWDVLTSEQQSSLTFIEAAPVSCLDWSPDGSVLAAGCSDTVSCWDVASKTVNRKLTGHINSVKRIKWSPSGRLLASSAIVDSVNVWDLKSDDPIAIIPNQIAWSTSGWAPAIAWGSNDQIFACETSRRTAAIYDVSQKREPIELRIPIEDLPEDQITPNTLAETSELQFSPDDQWLVSASGEEIRVWQWQQTDASLMSFQGTMPRWLNESEQIMFVPDDEPESIVVYDVPSGTQTGRLNGHIAELCRLQVSPDGSCLATGSYDTTVKLWALQDLHQNALALPTRESRPTISRFSHDGKQLAQYSPASGTVYLIDSQTATLKRSIEVPLDLRAPLAQLAWSPDGSKLVGLAYRDSQRDGSMVIWDVGTGERLQSIGDGAYLGSAVFSPDGTRLACRNLTSSSNWTTDVFSVASGERLLKIEDDAMDVSWSPDGTQLVTSSHKIWNAETGTPVKDLDKRWSNTISWSPDGKAIASVRATEAVQGSELSVWDIDSESWEDFLYAINGRVSSVRWSVDSKQLMTVAPDSVLLWARSARDSPLLTFPEQDLVVRRNSSEPIVDSRWSDDGQAILWTQAETIQIRTARPGFKSFDQDGEFGRNIIPKPRRSTRIAINHDAFVRRWHFASQTKPWGDRSKFVDVNKDELNKIQSAALMASSKTSPQSFVDFLPHFGSQNVDVVGYAARKIQSTSDQQVRMLVGSDDACRVWLNGELVIEALHLRAAKPDQESADVVLKSGENVILFELSQGQQYAGFYLRFESSAGEIVVVTDNDTVAVQTLEQITLKRRLAQANILSEELWNRAFIPNSLSPLTDTEIGRFANLCRQFPRPQMLRILGLAYYRTEKYDACIESLETLEKQVEKTSLSYSPHPIDLACLTMSHHESDNQDGATELQERLRQVCASTQFVNNVEAQHFLWEAESVLEGRQTGALRPVSSHKTFKGWSSAWAGDSTRIVLNDDGPNANPSGMLKSIDVASNDEIELLFGGRDPAWSPDGTRVACNKDNSIWLVNSDGSHSRELGKGTMPGWSADGKTLCYFSREDREIKAIDLSTDNAKPVSFFQVTSHLFPMVSPDGSKVAFARGGFAVVADVRSGKDLFRFPCYRWSGLLLGWSADSKYVALGDYGSGVGLWAMNANTGTTVQLLDGRYTLPRWSGDGRFISCDDRTRREVKVFEVEDLSLPE